MSLIRFSEATVIAIHAMVLVAGNPETCTSNQSVSSELRVSEAYLAKIFQRLVKSGYVVAKRGPSGGFKISPAGASSSLWDIYRTTEGAASLSNCLFDEPVCGGEDCILRNTLCDVNKQIINALSSVKLSSFISKKEECHVLQSV